MIVGLYVHISPATHFHKCFQARHLHKRLRPLLPKSYRKCIARLRAPLMSQEFQSQKEQEEIVPSNSSVYGGSNQANSDLDILFPERTHHKKNGQYTRSPSLVSSPDEHSSVASAAAGQQQSRDVPIHSKPNHWYSPLCNRWLSLFGAAVKITIMFLVHWEYALANIVMMFPVWFYIGHANPAVKPGVSSEFLFFRWLKNVILRCLGKQVQEYEQIVVTPAHPGLEVLSSQLNEDNRDFSYRRRYHQSSTVEGHFVDVDDD